MLQPGAPAKPSSRRHSTSSERAGHPDSAHFSADEPRRACDKNLHRDNDSKTNGCGHQGHDEHRLTIQQGDRHKSYDKSQGLQPRQTLLEQDQRK
jgi:hypothetical protein